MITLMIGAASIGAMIGGSRSLISAHKNNVKAKEMNNQARWDLMDANWKLDSLQNQSEYAFNVLGEKKLYILEKSLGEFINVFEQIKNVELTDVKHDVDFSKYIMEGASLNMLKDIRNSVSSNIMQGVFTAAMFSILGAGPGLLIFGSIAKSQSNKKIEDAYSNLAISRKLKAELDIKIDFYKGCIRRANLFYNLFVRVDALLTPLVYQMSDIIVNKGTDFNQFSEEEQKCIAAAATWAGILKAMIDTSIISEQGTLTPESRVFAGEICNKLGFPLSGKLLDINLENDPDGNITFKYRIDEYYKLDNEYSNIKGIIVRGKVEKGSIKKFARVINRENGEKFVAKELITDCSDLIDLTTDRVKHIKDAGEGTDLWIIFDLAYEGLISKADTLISEKNNNS